MGDESPEVIAWLATVTVLLTNSRVSLNLCLGGGVLQYEVEEDRPGSNATSAMDQLQKLK